MSFYDKYLKYKNKYLRLKNMMGGCDYSNTIPMDDFFKGTTSGECNICTKEGHMLDYPEMRFLLENKDFLEIDELYMFAIGVSEPNNIYVYPESKNKFIHCRRKKKLHITHNCLVKKNENVISAGMIKVINKDTIEITNDSGHYKPNSESLDYAECLLKKMGFVNVIKTAFDITPSSPFVLGPLPLDKQ